MADSLSVILPEAAAHPLLGGPYAYYALTPTSTSSLNTQIVATDIIDSSGAKSYTGWNIYCHTSVTATVISTQARRVQSVDLATGTLTCNRSWGRVTDASDLFWLTRDFTRNDFRDFANQALREMKRRVILTTQGLGSNILRYSPPTGIVRPEDVIDVGYRAYPSVTSDGQPRQLRWYGWEDNDGTLTLLTDRDFGTAEQLVFQTLRPFAAAGADNFTTDASTTAAPRDWLVAEIVSRALLTLWSMAEESDKPAIQKRLQAAGLLCQGFRAHYTPRDSRRIMFGSSAF